MKDLFIVVPFIVLFALVAVIAGRENRSREYDERQLLIRGNAYRFGYMTTIVLLAAACLCSSPENADLARVLTYLAFFGGMGVFSVYSIWKGGFFHLHQNPVRYTVLCFVIAGLNALTTGLRLREGESLVRIFTGREAMNPLLGLLFLVVGVTILLRRMADRREDE